MFSDKCFDSSSLHFSILCLAFSDAMIMLKTTQDHPADPQPWCPEVLYIVTVTLIIMYVISLFHLILKQVKLKIFTLTCVVSLPQSSVCFCRKCLSFHWLQKFQHIYSNVVFTFVKRKSSFAPKCVSATLLKQTDSTKVFLKNFLK